MRHYYRRYIVIGISVVLISLIFLATDEPFKSFNYYFEVLYNYVNFAAIYLTIFLIGLPSIASKLFATKSVIRYADKFQLTWSMHKRLFMYSLYYSSIISIVNLLVVLLFCPQVYLNTVEYYVFILIAFLVQVVGWYFIGGIYLLLYTCCKNTVITYFFTVLLFSITIIFSRVEALSSIKYYFSVYDLMYTFFYVGNASKIIVYVTYFSMLSAGALWLMYSVLKRTDLIYRAKGERE